MRFFVFALLLASMPALAQTPNSPDLPGNATEAVGCNATSCTGGIMQIDSFIRNDPNDGPVCGCFDHESGEYIRRDRTNGKFWVISLLNENLACSDGVNNRSGLFESGATGAKVRVRRYTQTGAIDSSWVNDPLGATFTWQQPNQSFEEEGITGAVVDDNHRLWLLLDSSTTGGYELWRFNANGGTLDTSFGGGDGKVEITEPWPGDVSTCGIEAGEIFDDDEGGLLIAPDNKLYIPSHRGDSSGGGVCILRLTSSGVPDTTFASDGYAVYTDTALDNGGSFTEKGSRIYYDEGGTAEPTTEQGLYGAAVDPTGRLILVRAINNDAELSDSQTCYNDVCTPGGPPATHVNDKIQVIRTISSSSTCTSQASCLDSSVNFSGDFSSTNGTAAYVLPTATVGNSSKHLLVGGVDTDASGNIFIAINVGSSVGTEQYIRYDANMDFLVMKLNASNASLNTAYGNNGFSTIICAESGDASCDHAFIVRALGVDVDGSIWFGGGAHFLMDFIPRGFIGKLASSGSWDTSFGGGDGKMISSIDIFAIETGVQFDNNYTLANFTSEATLTNPKMVAVGSRTDIMKQAPYCGF